MATSKRKFQIAAAFKGAHIIFDQINGYGHRKYFNGRSPRRRRNHPGERRREPEVTDLIVMLRKMGACIAGDGTSTVRIRGAKELHGTEHSVIPDRIEAGTFLIAAQSPAAT